MPHELAPLPYAYDALEPHIDEQTMKLHHDIHHAGYVKGFNAAEQKLAEAREANDFALVKHWERELAFHGSGHFLHDLYWKIMGPDGGGRPEGKLLAQIEKDFGSYEGFEAQFKAASAAVEGSGWGLLVKNWFTGQLEVLTAEKHQDLTQWVVEPLMVVDVWEHAYYLKFQNKRPAYIDSFMNVINWREVERRFDKD
jgi:Fe-Mn family superoxide dismutase